MSISMYHRFLSAMEIPEDLTSGAALVEMTGQNAICIYNFLGIIEYSNERLLLQCKGCRLEVTGKNLQIESFTKEELHLKGTIEQTNYV